MQKWATPPLFFEGRATKMTSCLVPQVTGQGSRLKTMQKTSPRYPQVKRTRKQAPRKIVPSDIGELLAGRIDNTGHDKPMIGRKQFSM